MSRDMHIYGRRTDPVPIGDVLEKMSARGMGVTWKSSSSRKTNDWSVGGSFHSAELGGTSDVRASAESLDEAWRKDVVESYAAELGDAERSSILAAEHVYNLHGAWSAAGPGDRPLLALADTIAELADGVIIDTLTNRVFSHKGFRKANPWLTKGPAAKKS